VLVELCRRKTIAKIWNYDLQGGVITLWCPVLDITLWFTSLMWN